MYSISICLPSSHISQKTRSVSFKILLSSLSFLCISIDWASSLHFSLAAPLPSSARRQQCMPFTVVWSLQSVSAYEARVKCKAGMEDESVRTDLLLPAQRGTTSGDIVLNCKSLFRSLFSPHRVASLQQGYFIFIKNSLCMSGLLHRRNGRWRQRGNGPKGWWWWWRYFERRGSCFKWPSVDRLCSIWTCLASAASAICLNASALLSAHMENLLSPSKSERRGLLY